MDFRLGNQEDGTSSGLPDRSAPRARSREKAAAANCVTQRRATPAPYAPQRLPRHAHGIRLPVPTVEWARVAYLQHSSATQTGRTLAPVNPARIRAAHAAPTSSGKPLPATHPTCCPSHAAVLGHRIFATSGHIHGRPPFHVKRRSPGVLPRPGLRDHCLTTAHAGPGGQRPQRFGGSDGDAAFNRDVDLELRSYGAPLRPHSSGYLCQTPLPDGEALVE